MERAVSLVSQQSSLPVCARHSQSLSRVYCAAKTHSDAVGCCLPYVCRLFHNPAQQNISNPANRLSRIQTLHAGVKLSLSFHKKTPGYKHPIILATSKRKFPPMYLCIMKVQQQFVFSTDTHTVLLSYRNVCLPMGRTEITIRPWQCGLEKSQNALKCLKNRLCSESHATPRHYGHFRAHMGILGYL